MSLTRRVMMHFVIGSANSRRLFDVTFRTSKQRSDNKKVIMKKAVDSFGLRAVVAALVLILPGMPVLGGHACAMTAKTETASRPDTVCACCATTGHREARHRCCCAPGVPVRGLVGVDRCSCGQTPSDAPPALPANPSQNRINPLRPLTQLLDTLAASPESLGLGCLSTVDISPSKAPAAHLLCCVWRC